MMEYQSDNHYRAIFEGTVHFTLLLDRAGLVLESNPAALALGGVKKGDVVGRPLWETPWWRESPESRGTLQQAVAAAAAGRVVQGEVEFEGSGLPAGAFDFSVSPVSGAGGVVSLIFEGRDITRRKRAEAALQETLARHQAVLSSTLDPVITIDGYGIMQSASRSVERVLGFQPDELIGRNISMLMPEPHRSMHDTYLAKYRSTGQTNILGRTRQFDAQRKDGVIVPIELSVARVDVPGVETPLFTGIIHDISDRKRAEREISLLQSLALAISESRSMTEALTLTIQTICEAAEWDYGEVWLPEATPEGEQLRPILTWSRPDRGFEAVEAACEGLSFNLGRGLPGRVWQAKKTIWLGDLVSLLETEYKRSRIAVDSGVTAVVGVPILSRDEPVAVLLFFLRDTHNEPPRLLDLVTAAAAPLGNAIRRKQAEDELEHHRQQLEELVAERTQQLDASHEQLRLADRLAAIGTLAAGLGHDMNNVLLPVRCRLDALEAIELPGEMREQFQAVRRSVAYLQQLSDGLHLLALDPDDQDATTGRTNIHEWWGQVGALLRKALPRHVSFEVDLAEGLPEVSVAPHRLTQAVLNLVVNSGEAIVEKGDVRLWARAHDDGRAVHVAVKDTGVGMTEEVKRRALDPFFTTKTRGLGTGLGLSLVRGVVQGAGGLLRIESAPGKGTTVTIMLPAVEEPSLGGLSSEGPPVAEISVSDRRAASFVGALLSSAGFQVNRVTVPRHPAGSIWVTEASSDALVVARQYSREGRQIIVLGGSREWDELGAIGVPDSEDFEEIKSAVGEAIAGALGE
jgi:two-component system, cell cycle sensor histidine kinase and response regulator CckA